MTLAHTLPSASRRSLCSAVLAASLAACTSSSPPVSGSWTGTTGTTDGTGTTGATDPSSMPIRLALTEGSGSVTGTVLVTFPNATDYTEVDTVTGTRKGDALHLVGATGLVLDLTRSGGTLAGSVTFGSDGGAPVVGRVKVTQ